MNQKPHSQRWKIFLFVLSIFVAITIIDACRKADHEAVKPDDPESGVVSASKFFNVPASADKRLKAIAKTMQEEENKRHFIEKLVKKIGYPPMG